MDRPHARLFSLGSALGLSHKISQPIIKGIARPITDPSGNGAVFASAGVSTSPTTNTTKSVSTGFSPKLVIPFGNLDDQNRSTSSALFSIGAGSSATTRSAYSLSSVNGVTTSDAVKNQIATKINSQLTTTGTVLEEADLESLDSSGFTFDWTTTDAAERILNHIAIGGSGVRSTITQHQMNATNSAQSFAHGLGVTPSALIFISNLSSNPPPETIETIKLSIGCWGGSSQFSAAQYAVDGLTTANCRRSLSVNSVVSDISTSYRRTMAVSSVDTTNVNCTYPVTTTAAERYFTMVAISGVKSQVGTFDCAGSTDDLVISCSGITPKLFLPVLIPQGVDLPQTILQDMGITVGACDGTNNVSCGINDEHGVTTTNSNRHQSSNTIVEHLKTGTKVFESTVSFSGQSVVIDPTTNGSSDRGQGGYLIIGQ